MAEAACDEEPVKKRARVHTKRFCAHCGCYVSKSTWYNHKHHVEPLNSGLNRQQTSSVLEETSEFEFSNTDSEEGESCNEDCEHTKENIESEQSEDSEFNFEKSSSDTDTVSGPELWTDSEEEMCTLPTENQDAFITVHVLAHFILLWQSVFRVANVAISFLLQFFSLFVYHLSVVTQLKYIRALAEAFPNTIIKARRIIGMNCDKFQNYVCCPKCCSIYELDDCYEKIGTCKVPRRCSFIRFPRHPILSKRKACESNILKRIKTTKKEMYKPIKVYCYKSILSSLSDILSRPGMIQLCDSWRKRDLFPGLYTDIYDGNIWKHFENSGFFSQPNSYGFLLNIDWFEPFEHSVYSVGVIFLSLLNLPRHIRYSQENILLCGLIPGPKEPSLNINSFLEPLVGELLLLWRGKEIVLPSGPTVVRAMLLCVSCDSPAMRKVAGFLSHSATKGCFKCLKSFPTASFGQKPDYSGFNREDWSYRLPGDCFDAGMKHKHANTAKEQQTIEKNYGVRYTALLTLPYYNSVNFCMIDPMHNLLLGSAKTFLTLWKEHFSQSGDFVAIQESVDHFVTPAGVGRLPLKVENGFANFKAEQWKNWILIYSLICFKPVLSIAQYNLWLTFVQACSLLCSRAISHNAIILADRLIHEYCCLFEFLFGKNNCYPNLHLHCHLKQCLLDFGPATSFWLFSFERMNGVLGSFHTNNRAIEIQLLRKFLSKQQISTLKSPDSEFSHSINTLLGDMQSTKDVTNSKGLLMHIIRPFEKQSIMLANDNSKLLPPTKEKAFCSAQINLISKTFSAHFADFVKVLILHKETKLAVFNGDLYGSYFSRHKNSSLAIVHTVDGAKKIHHSPSIIVGFVECSVVLKVSEKEVTTNYKLAKICPLQEHQQKSYYPQPIEVWRKPDDTLLNDTSVCVYVFMSCLLCRCAYSPFHHSYDPGIAVVPCNPYIGVTNYCHS